MSDLIRAIDLCSGAGGWACAARGLPIHIELAVDHWPVACKSYELNHPQTRVECLDLRDAASKSLVLEAAKGVDLVLGGIPCEWLSKYRELVKVVPAEITTQRDTLDSVLSLVKQIGPRYWCLEDVPALVKHLPIMTPYQLINSRDYSAQRRKRVYVGDFPAPEPGKCAEVMRHRMIPGPHRIGPRAINRTPVTTRTFNQQTTLAGYLDRKAPTVVNCSTRRDAEMVVVDPDVPGGKRQQCWREAALLQGFPTDYLFYGGLEDVGTQIGRAVQIDTGRAILEGIVRDWESGRAKGAGQS